MGYSKPQSRCENPNNWEKMGEVCFVSSISTAPTFQARRKKALYQPILSSIQIDYVPTNEGVNATVWRCKNK